MRARVALLLTILGLAMAVTAAPVAAGGGSRRSVRRECEGVGGEFGSTGGSESSR